jgi:hypothetical protein
MQRELVKSEAVTPTAADATGTANEKATGKVECNACPVLCQISPGKAGACDRYANLEGRLIRVAPLLFLDHAIEADDASPTVFGADACAHGEAMTLTGIGASTTYPEYHPAPFIVSSVVGGVDTITAVTEGIFSYCSMRIKIDTDRFIGLEGSPVRYKGEHIGHVATVEYGSRMISLGGVDHLTGGSKKEGRMTTEAILSLGNKFAIEMTVDNGPSLFLRAGDAPVIDSIQEKLMRVGCGAATIGMFAKQWQPVVDEVIVVDDHITGLLSEHRAGKGLGMRASGIRLRGRRSTPGRYFQVAGPGTGWGGTDIEDPLAIIDTIDPTVTWPGMRMLAVSTTGEHAQWFVFDDNLVPRPQPMPSSVEAVVDRLKANCEPSLTTVMFVVGAGGSLRAGITDNPVLLTRAVKSGAVKVTMGGAPAYVWPGGGITVMADVSRMPDLAFGTVPTPAIVAPIEFTMSREVFTQLEGHIEAIRPLADIILAGATHSHGAPTGYRRFAASGTLRD